MLMRGVLSAFPGHTPSRSYEEQRRALHPLDIESGDVTRLATELDADEVDRRTLASVLLRIAPVLQLCQPRARAWRTPSPENAASTYRDAVRR